MIQAKKGDWLDYKRKPTEFEGWRWCTDHSQNSAWGPELWVNVSGTSCQLIRDYVSTELPLDIGDKVEIIELVSGWAWIRNSSSETGWVPTTCLELFA